MVDSQTDKFGILSIRGRDKIGVAASASGFLAKRGANLIDEDFSTLRRYFMGMFVFKAKAIGMRRITEEADRVLKRMEPVVKEIDEDEADAIRNRAAEAPRRVVLRYELDVMAENEPRIANTIEKIMRERCINMEKIKGRTLQTYGLGTDLYSGSFRLKIGNAGTLKRLREDLQRLEDEHGWEIDLRPEGTPSSRFQVFTVGIPLSNAGRKPRLMLSEL